MKRLGLWGLTLWLVGCLQSHERFDAMEAGTADAAEAGARPRPISRVQCVDGDPRTCPLPALGGTRFRAPRVGLGGSLEVCQCEALCEEDADCLGFGRNATCVENLRGLPSRCYTLCGSDLDCPIGEYCVGPGGTDTDFGIEYSCQTRT